MIPNLPDPPYVFNARRRALTLDEMRFLGSHPTIDSLELANCPIGDEHIRELGLLPELSYLGLEGTKITDAVMESLSKLPKLKNLCLDRTRITGASLDRLHDSTTLEILSLSSTDVRDETIGLAAGIPHLRSLGISETSIGFEGLLRLAAHPRLNVFVEDDRFTQEQWMQFEATRHRLAGKPDLAREVDIEAARTVLLGFFEAMNEWESAWAKADGNTGVPRRWKNMEEKQREDTRLCEDLKLRLPILQAECHAIFEKYCTPNPTRKGRPNGLSYGIPPTYSSEKIVGEVQPSRSKILIFTRSNQGTFHRRYTIINKDGKWRVDRREIQMDRWKNTGF